MKNIVLPLYHPKAKISWQQLKRDILFTQDRNPTADDIINQHIDQMNDRLPS